MKSTVKISEAEWEIMAIVWQSSPITANQIIEQVSAKRDWQPRTIRTLIARLTAKGALRATLHEGKRYLYEPRVSMEQCLRQESKSFRDRVFGGAPAAMLIHLVKETKLTRDEIKELKRILTEKEK